MKFYFKFGVVFCVIALAISASAGSITTSSISAPNAVPATFHYNAVTGGSLSFVGDSIIGGFSGSVTQPQSGVTLLVNATAGGHTVSNSLSNLLELGSDSSVVPVTSARGGKGRQQQVPEGGSQLSYLAASGLVLFAGIFITGKQRRRPTEN